MKQKSSVVKKTLDPIWSNATFEWSGLKMQMGMLELVVMDYDGTFANRVPLLFAAVVSASRFSSHLRMLESSGQSMSLLLEHDSCNAVALDTTGRIGWLMVAADEAPLLQRLTLSSDLSALLAVNGELGLPSYLRWSNGSDPCSDR